jgi:4-aminobutyrate aminotransferase
VVGKHIMDRISKWPETLASVGDVRGLGLMIGVEIVKDKKTKEMAGPERDQIVDKAFSKGALFLGAGANTIRICPPLIVTKEEADIAIDILEAAIKEAAFDGVAAGNGKPAGS